MAIQLLRIVQFSAAGCDGTDMDELRKLLLNQEKLGVVSVPPHPAEDL